MAIDMAVYYLYELDKKESACVSEMILLKVVRPAWRNAIEPEGIRAEEAMEKRRDEMLKSCLDKTANQYAKLVGKFEGWPEGDAFYEEFGENYIEFWFAASGYGNPWMVFSKAESEEEFWRIINEDELLANMKALPPAQKVTAMFFTENDFEFSAVGIKNISDI